MNQIRPSAMLSAGFTGQGAPRIAPIALFVMGIHLVLILWLVLVAPAKTLLPKPKSRVVVQTVQLSTPKPKAPSQQIEDWSAPVAVPEAILLEETPPTELEQMPRLEESQLKQPQVVEIAPPKPKTPAKVKETPKEIKKVLPKQKNILKEAPKEKHKERVSKKVEKKKTPLKKKETSKEKTAPKEQAVFDAQTAKQTAQKAKQQELLKKAQESIAKIRRDGVTIVAEQKGRAADLKIPQLTLAAVAAADESSSLSVGEISYRDELAGRLKLLLTLPEYGSVKLKLTLLRSGKVSKVAIVSAGSSQNRAYVEKLMPTLQFPPFGTQFGQEPEYTFTITLNNDF